MVCACGAVLFEPAPARSLFKFKGMDRPPCRWSDRSAWIAPDIYRLRLNRSERVGFTPWWALAASSQNSKLIASALGQ